MNNSAWIPGCMMHTKFMVATPRIGVKLTFCTCRERVYFVGNMVTCKERVYFVGNIVNMGLASGKKCSFGALAAG